MKIDLDELERRVENTEGNRCGCAVTLVLISRIRELETAVRALAVGSLVGEVTADRARELLEKGVVLP